jgi:hypothetical protein
MPIESGSDSISKQAMASVKSSIREEWYEGMREEWYIYEGGVV